MNNFKKVQLSKSKNRSILNGEAVWENYRYNLTNAINSFCWDIIWHGEHSNRGLIISGILESLKKSEYMQIERRTSSGRADIVILSKNSSEVIELKNRNIFVNVSLSEYSKNPDLYLQKFIDNLETKNIDKLKEQVFKVNEQAKRYKKSLSVEGWKINSSTSLIFNQLVFVPGEIKIKKWATKKKELLIFNEFYKNFIKKTSKNLLFKKSISGNNGIAFLPTHPSLSVPQNKNIMKAYFSAPIKKDQRNEYLKYFGGIIAIWHVDK